MNSFVKALLITVGIVTLCIAGCTALTIGGCATVVGVAAYQVSNLPDYANASTLSKSYGTDFDSITQSLKQDVSLRFSDNKITLNDDILAVIAEINGRDVDIYKKYDDAELNGHVARNSAGTGTLILNGKPTDCLVYLIEWNEVDYLVCIKDTFKTKATVESHQQNN
jgi:hypothetical protein